jgi:mycofactocin precursor
METTTLAPITADEAIADDDNYVEEELLVEEISIDGMCGVY